MNNHPLFEKTRDITINGLLSGELLISKVKELIKMACADELYEQCEAMRQAMILFDEMSYIRQVRDLLKTNDIKSTL